MALKWNLGMHSSQRSVERYKRNGYQSLFIDNAERSGSHSQMEFGNEKMSAAFAPIRLFP